ncbi:MAG: hypothetical protein KDB58_03490 [Solirubrobacterales bacterium]|nr:hypothetical protein [Solirubrobacterales bacterium]
MAPAELIDEDYEPEPEPLRIRVMRDGSLDVAYAGVPLEVSFIDADERAVEYLQRIPRTVRDA